jgi:L-aminopeptidase/D-esterase-like protein
VTRAADLGIRIGILASGPTASITDVPGVGVGHATVWRDEPGPGVRRRLELLMAEEPAIGIDDVIIPIVAEEAVLNSLLASPTVTGRDGNTSHGLAAEQVRDLLQAAGRSEHGARTSR